MTVKSNQTKSPLHGYRVLDLTDEKGFFCGRILADLGAEVVKIESPGGDADRQALCYSRASLDSRSANWFAFNTSKKSITLDITKADGQAIFKRLAASADFIIESCAPGYLGRLGLGYKALHALNPRLIVTSITPFGQTGPYREYAASDIVAFAMGGVMYLVGDPDRSPLMFGLGQVYLQASLQAAAGAMLAHYYRERSNLGQHVDVSIQECMAFVSAFSTAVPELWEFKKMKVHREGPVSVRASLSKRIVWPCKDGQVAWWVDVGVMHRQTEGLVACMTEKGQAGDLDKVDWAQADVTKITQALMDHWQGQFGRFFLKHNKRELHDMALRWGFWLFPVSTVDEVLENPQLKFREFWTHIRQPELGKPVIYPGPLLRTSQYVPARKRAPAVGEHNDVIYRKELGLSEEQLSMLKQLRVV